MSKPPDDKKKGNNGNHGKKGRSGRKTAVTEKKIADLLVEAFSTGVNLEALEKVEESVKNKKGVIKLFELAIVRAVHNDEKLFSLLHKLLPEKVESQTTVTNIDPLKEAQDRAKKFNEKNNG